MESFRPYAEKFADVLGNIAGKAGDDVSPLLIPREEVKNVHVVLLTSDRGLCGGFNTNLIEAAESFMEERVSAGQNVSFTNFGKKGRDWCRKEKLTIVDEYLNVVGGKIRFSTASTTAQKLIDAFLKEEYDEVYVVFSKFVSMANQVPHVQQLLPIPVIETVEESQQSVEEEKGYMPEHICEPSPDELLNTMLPRNVYVQLFNSLLETTTSEHASRMRAMDNATKACDDMIESLTLAYNKARQAAITMELMDIVGGAEALRG
jgi:F-type H+-transporting ATPase subunit gamma